MKTKTIIEFINVDENLIKSANEIIDDLKKIIDILPAKEREIAEKKLIEFEKFKRYKAKSEKITLAFISIFLISVIFIIVINFNEMRLGVTDLFQTMKPTKDSVVIATDTVNLYEQTKTIESLKLSIKDKEIELRDIKIDNLKWRLKLIQDQYEIKIIETKNTIRFESGKIDSALILYPFYKNKLSYDKAKDTWIVK